jgi:hypothetical protein
VVVVVDTILAHQEQMEQLVVRVAGVRLQAELGDREHLAKEIMEEHQVVVEV